MNIYTSRTIYVLFIVAMSQLKGQSGADSLSNNTLKAISQSDSIVQGKFVVAPIAGGAPSSLESPRGQAIQGTIFTVPFEIQKSIKGNASGKISVQLFYPTTQMSGPQCILPIREKLLLFLRKDANGVDFDLVNPWGGWLVIPESANADSGSTTPEAMILDGAKAFIKDRLARPQAVIEYPTALVNQAPYEVLNPDPNILIAIRMGRDLAPSDPEFVALLKQYAADSGAAGHAARKALLASGNIQYSLQILAAHDNSPTGAVEHNTEAEIEETLVNSKNLDSMKPLIVKALASKDPQIRLCTLRGLAWNQNTKDKSLYPQLITLLDDPDPEVQHAAMDCIFSMSGEVNRDVKDREIDLPETETFEVNPNPWITRYKAWWAKHKESLKAR